MNTMRDLTAMRAALEVVSIGPLATVQDRGRFGYAASAVPRSGPLDEDAMHAAIAAVSGSYADDAAIELPLLGARFRVRGALVASIDGETARAFHDDELLDVPRSERAVRYLALQGGVDVRRVLGSRATLVTAALGGFEGRALRVGDVVEVGAHRHSTLETKPIPSLSIETQLQAFPHAGADRHALDALSSTTFRVDARSDRVGTRLDCTPLPSTPALAPSRPLTRGAIQLPPDGRPVVIGPDGPTVGGYRVVAVLTRASCALLARLRPGVPFRIALEP